MEKGDILKVRPRGEGGITNYIHPFVYWEGFENEFTGIMLTHSSEYNNIPLLPSHIEPGLCIRWDESYFVDQILLKNINISGLEIKGRLSQEGIKYIEEHISSFKALTWNDYKKKEQPD